MAGKKSSDTKNDLRVDLKTNIGVFSFPHIFKQTVSKNDDGDDVYEIQFLIPKSDRAGVKAIHDAITKVAKAKWGDKYKSVKSPLRDGDKEADELTEDGSTRGEKYPERLGHYFMNARSKKPIAVVDRDRDLITDHDAVYGGCKGILNVTMYPYITKGNQGVGVGLNGVQKVADGESFGGAGKPSVESMFDMVDEDEDLGNGLDDDEDEKPKKKGKKSKKSEPEPEPKKKKSKKA